MPPTDNLVIFMFNPFKSRIMSQVLGNIKKSLEKEPRQLLVAYQNPVHRDLFDEDPVFKLQSYRHYRFHHRHRLFLKRPGGRVAIYKSEVP